MTLSGTFTTSRRFVFLLLLLSFILSTFLYARPGRATRAKSKASAAAKSATLGEKLSIVVDGSSRKKVSLYRFNNLRYCALASLRIDSADLLQAKRAKAKKGVATVSASSASSDVVISNHVIRTVATSFFVAAEKNQQQRIAQMTVPAISVRNTLLVPYPQFFDALSTLGLCTLNEEEGAVRWVNESKRAKVVAASEDDAINPLTPVVPLGSSKKGAMKKGKTDVAVDPVREMESSSPISDPEPEVPSTLRYQLPQDLKRRELEDSVKIDGQSLNALQPLGGSAAESAASGEWLASLSTFSKARPARITSIRTEVEKSRTSIHFQSDKDLATIPDPSFEEGLITLRIPQAVNAVKDLGMIRKLNVSSVSSGLDDEAQIYRIQLRSSERRVELERVDDRHLILHIAPIESKVATARTKWNLDVIVIDAGHGGKDVGAESVHKKYEKDITLAVALKLRDEIKKKMPETKIVLTRSTDVFVELDKRGEIANKAGGKLFISIHCNSTPTKPSPASGFETYVLSPAKTNTAVEVANRENAVIQLEDKSERYKALNDDQLIVATLAQNSFVKLSSTFAALVQKNMKVCTSMCERTVNQAGFIVLIGASMPAVLVETGFVSNTDDEKMLTSSSGQQKIARGIASAVKEYASVYSKMLKN